MTELWTASEAAKSTGGTAQGDWAATGVSIDTRTLVPGDLFVALAAARDGHDFVAQALENGAAAALVSHVPEGVGADAPLLIVRDVLEGLEALGRAARARTQARVVAVTGSVGKTSTKEMLREMLSFQGRTHAAEASYNNHWGVPLTLARMPAETDYAIIEIGMNHPGEIAPLAQMARPHVAMVTTVAAAHLEAFENIEGIAREKAAIFSGLEPGGIAVINADLPTRPILDHAADHAGAEIVYFGTSEHADWQLKEVDLQDEATIAHAAVAGEPFAFRLATAGTHFAMNGLGALACVDALGADWGLATSDLGRWTPYRGRGVRETIRPDSATPEHVLTLYDDSYNANPTSMAAALEVLAHARPPVAEGARMPGRRIAILGAMGELGPEGPALHASIAALPVMAEITTVHTVGPLAKHLHDALPDAQQGQWFESAGDCAKSVRELLDIGDVVLVKGSLSTGLAKVIEAIRSLEQAKAADEEV